MDDTPVRPEMTAEEKRRYKDAWKDHKGPIPTQTAYLSTRDKDGELRNGAAGMFERYGFF